MPAGGSTHSVHIVHPWKVTLTSVHLSGLVGTGDGNAWRKMRGVRPMCNDEGEGVGLHSALGV